MTADSRAELRSASASAALRLHAPARLHLGFLDPGASLGRRYGSLGLVITGFETVLELGDAPPDSPTHLVSGGPAEAKDEVGRAAAHLTALSQRTGLHQPLSLHLEQVLPAHAGFGSGTQLALAVGRAFVQWHGLHASTAEIAHWLGRGVRSGVGIAGFDQGGLLVDGGPGADGAPAPLLARVTLPAAWRVVLVLDPSLRGLSGTDEREAIRTLDPLPREAAADVCHQVLMRVLPGAAADDFPAFAHGLSEVQRRLGEHFAPAQGGSVYTSAAVGRAIAALAHRAGRSPAAAGQSSWGPTGFLVLPSAHDAAATVAAARAAGELDPGLQVHIVEPRPYGAVVHDGRALRS